MVVVFFDSGGSGQDVAPVGGGATPRALAAAGHRSTTLTKTLDFIALFSNDVGEILNLYSNNCMELVPSKLAKAKDRQCVITYL